MSRFAAMALLLLPTLAFGQEAKKFNAKQLEAEFPKLAVFTKGKVIDNEVIYTRGEDTDFVQAVYVTKADLKKVLEFYKEKLGSEAKEEGDEALGTLKYVFPVNLLKADKRVFKVIVEPVGKGKAQITLHHRAVTEDDVPVDLEE